MTLLSTLLCLASTKQFPQVGDQVLGDGTCCIEPGRCGGVGIYVPACARNTSYIPAPTRVYPVPAPPAPPTPPTAPPLPVLECWDGSTCPGRVETQGIQCCSAGVKAGQTCSQIFICDQGRTCTGPLTCYQREFHFLDRDCVVHSFLVNLGCQE